MIVSSIDKVKNRMLYDFLRLKNHSTPHVYDRLTTSKMLSSKSISIARLGDGELSMIFDKHSLGFQPYNEHLRERLIDIVKSPSSYDNVLVCLPDCFHSVKTMKPSVANFWKQWVSKNYSNVNSIIDNEYNYGDSYVTRLYLPWKDKSNESVIIQNIQSTWENKKIIIVEGKETRFGVGNDLLSKAKSVSRIICPSVDSWSKYKEIFNACKTQKLSNETVFVLALGPTATVLTVDLASLGYRSLDLGHMDLQYEYLIRKMTNKGIIPGKYNNEVDNGNIVDNCSDEEYLNSIIYNFA